MILSSEVDLYHLRMDVSTQVNFVRLDDVAGEAVGARVWFRRGSKWSGGKRLYFTIPMSPTVYEAYPLRKARQMLIVGNWQTWENRFSAVFRYDRATHTVVPLATALLNLDSTRGRRGLFKEFAYGKWLPDHTSKQEFSKEFSRVWRFDSRTRQLVSEAWKRRQRFSLAASCAFALGWSLRCPLALFGPATRFELADPPRRRRGPLWPFATRSLGGRRGRRTLAGRLWCERPLCWSLGGLA